MGNELKRMITTHEGGKSLLESQSDGSLEGAINLRPGYEYSIVLGQDGSIRQLFRRTDALDVQLTEEKPIEFAGLVYDNKMGCVSLPDGTTKNLTRLEAKVFSLMIASTNMVITPEEFKNNLFPRDGKTIKEVSDTVKVIVRRLRRKIEGNVDPEDSLIKNIRGFGYGLFDINPQKVTDSPNDPYTAN